MGFTNPTIETILMPYKDPEKRKKYMREYMRDRRAAYKDLQKRVKELEKAVFGKKKKRR